MSAVVKLTRVQQESLAAMRAQVAAGRGIIDPFDFGSTTIAQFKRLGLIEKISVIGFTRYRFTDKGLEIAQMAGAS